MSTVLTESKSFDATVTVPADGDTRNAASVNVPFQALGNRTRYLKAVGDAGAGLLHGGRVLTQMSTSTVKVSAIKALILGATLLSAGETTIGSAQLEGGGGFANSTWYYVYAYDNSGVLAFQISTTVPDASLVYKNATTSHRYLGCFRTNGAGNILAFRCVNGRFRYRVGDANTTLTALRGLDNGQSTSEVNVSLAALVPPHAKLLHLRAEIVRVSGAATSGAGSIYSTTGATDAQTIYYLHAASEKRVLGVQVDMNATNGIYYLVSSGDLGLTLYVLGWDEERD